MFYFNENKSLLKSRSRLDLDRKSGFIFFMKQKLWISLCVKKLNLDTHACAPSINAKWTFTHAYCLQETCNVAELLDYYVLLTATFF